MRLERGGDGEVEPAPADGRGVGQQGLADQLVGEGVAGRPALGWRDQPGPLGLVEGVEQVAAGLTGHPLDQVELEHPAPHGGREQRPLGGLGQPGQPLPDNHADTGGDLEVLDAEVAPEPALVVEEHARLGQVEVDLLGEERVALALGVDAVHEGGRWLLAGQPGHKGRDVGLGQRSQRDTGHQPLADQLVEDPGQRRGRLDLVVAEGADDHDRHVGQARGQVLEQQQGRLVGPVQVLEDEHQRALGGGPPDELPHAEPQVATGLLGREVQRRRDLGDDQPQAGGDTGDLGGGLAEGVAQGGGAARGHHALLDHLGEGQVRRQALVVGAVTGKDPQPVGVRLGVDLLQQPGLADPGLTRDQHERAAPDPGVLERPAQVGPLPVAPDERGLDRPDGAAGGVSSPLRLVQPPAVGEPAEPVEPAVDEREPSRRLDRVPHGRGDQDLAPGRLRHDPGGGVDGLTVEGAVALDGRSVVQPDPDPDAAVGVVPPVLLEGLLDGDGAAQAVRRGGEGGHEPVAEEGRLLAAVRADGPPDDPLVVVQHLVGDPVTVARPELDRALHVGEQDRDRLVAPRARHHRGRGGPALTRCGSRMVPQWSVPELDCPTVGPAPAQGWPPSSASSSSTSPCGGSNGWPSRPS